MLNTTDLPSITELLNLTDKVAVVTGGAVGVGYAISRRLAQSGALVIIADIDAEKARQASDDLNLEGLHTFPFNCDVSHEQSVNQMMNTVVSKRGSLDILVNNAGIFPRRPLTEMSGEEFDRVLTINLKGAFMCSREAAKQMIIRRTGGCIINVAS